MDAARVEEVFARAARSIRPPPRLTVSEWADAYRRLSPESSAEPGRWRTSRAEYQREIMDAVSNPRIAEVVVMTSAQVGKTEILNNAVGYFIDQDPAAILVVQPILEMGEAWSKDRLAPMIRDTPCLTGLVAEPNSKGSGNTLLHKTFADGFIAIAGSNSAPSLSSRAIRVLLLDEVDRYEESAGTEGDPVSLARKRTKSFWNRRVLLTSTPTIKGVSRIERAYEQSDKRRYWVPCPHCAAMQVLRWANVRPKDDPEAARIACVECGALLDDGDRVDMIARGEWRAEAPFKGTAGFHLWEIYSPWSTLAEMVDDYIKAKPYPETLKTFVNMTLGESWEDRLGEKIVGDSLASRAEDYAQWTVPAGALLVTAGVDVQHDRLALTVWGYGPNEEAWVIGWTEIYGSPADAATWARLDESLARRFPHELGGEIGVARTCVDAGDGTTTSFVLNYCRRRPNRLAIKGQSQDGKPEIGHPTKVEFNWRGVARPRAALLWPVGVDTIKGWLMGRLRSETTLVHFPADLPAEFYAQLTAENLETKHVRGMPVRRWVKAPSARNEALDASVYAYAAAVHADLKSANWAVLRGRVAKPPGESPSGPIKALGAPVRRPAWVQGGKGFVTGWRR